MCVRFRYDIHVVETTPAKELYHGAKRESLEGHTRDLRLGRVRYPLRCNSHSACLLASIEIHGVDG